MYISIYVYIYMIYLYCAKKENEKSIYHWYATLSFLPLHLSGDQAYFSIFCLSKNEENRIAHTT